MIAHMKANKKLKLIVSDFLIKERKFNVFVVFISQSYFAVPKTIRLNATHHSIMKMPNKGELQETYFKMTVSEKIRTVHDKMKQNKAQYNLDRRTAISTSGNVDNHEFLTGQDILPKKELSEKAATIKRFE